MIDRSPFTIAIIGGIACGKTTALNFFKQQQIMTVSADEIAKQLTQIGTKEYIAIVAKLGKTILQKNNELNRTKLRNLLITSPDFKIWLESLLHPQIKKILLHIKKECKSPYFVMEIPLLKNKNDYKIDKVLCLHSASKIQMTRLEQRNLSKQDIHGLLDLQIPYEQRIKLADDIIENNGNLEELNLALEKIHQKYLILAKHH